MIETIKSQHFMFLITSIYSGKEEARQAWVSTYFCFFFNFDHCNSHFNSASHQCCSSYDVTSCDIHHITYFYLSDTQYFNITFVMFYSIFFASRFIIHSLLRLVIMVIHLSFHYILNQDFNNVMISFRRLLFDECTSRQHDIAYECLR